MIITLLLAATLTWTPPPVVRCQTYEDKTLQRWQTLCSDGTRRTSTWNKTLGRWETVVTPPPGGRRAHRRPGR